MTVERTLTARNEATGSENRIHSDGVAREHGFRGGLVPGVSVYGYLMELAGYRPGTVWVRFFKPVFDGDELLLRMRGDLVTAERGGELCAEARLGSQELRRTEEIPEQPLPDPAQRPVPSETTVVPGTVLGTVKARLEPTPMCPTIPGTLLNLANQVLMQNFRLGPWLHAGSEVTTVNLANWGEPVTARSRILDRFEKKGREFVVVEVRLWSGERLLEAIQHTAIYRL